MTREIWRAWYREARLCRRLGASKAAWGSGWFHPDAASGQAAAGRAAGLPELPPARESTESRFLTRGIAPWAGVPVPR